MAPQVAPWLWTAVSGAVGGLINAVAIRDYDVLWSMVEGPDPRRPRLAQLGILGSVLLGALGATATWAVCFDVVGGPVPAVGPAGWRPWLATCVIGCAWARLVTDRLEKRLLLAAACAAAAAPAVPQETVQLLAAASPRAAYEIADGLMPRTRRRE